MQSVSPNHILTYDYEKVKESEKKTGHVFSGGATILYEPHRWPPSHTDSAITFSCQEISKEKADQWPTSPLIGAIYLAQKWVSTPTLKHESTTKKPQEVPKNDPQFWIWGDLGVDILTDWLWDSAVISIRIGAEWLLPSINLGAYLNIPVVVSIGDFTARKAC